MKLSRREFTRSVAVAGAGTAASLVVSVGARRAATGSKTDPVGEKTRRNLKAPASQGDDDILIRMQQDLATAMKKPVEKRRWVMLIDTRKCVGCHACTIGCVAENKLPPGVVYRPVTTEERGEYPNVHLRFMPRPCMQCNHPPCVAVCPVKATWQRPDKVVTIDYDKCIGCRYCLTACPYGARTSDFGMNYQDDAAAGAPKGPTRPLLAEAPNETAPSHEYAKHWDRRRHGSPIGNARKCHFCLHRLEVGKLPMCVSTCVGRATYFGDANEAGSLISQMMAKNTLHTLLAHHNTDPNVFYID